ncbi:MAG TPA: hypothetical protein VF221_13030 [Chloroflexota bacterium]
MVTHDAPRAALDIGSNTIRLLVARPSGDTLRKLDDVSEFVRLGKGVDASGKLQPDRVDAALEAIRRLAERGRSSGAGTPIAIATSAVRDAANGQEFVDRVRKETGIDVRVLSGDEEARLTFLGATLGRSLDGGAVVVDLGGGSAEIIAADSNGISWARSLQFGSGRLTEQFIHHDPPQMTELNAVATYVKQMLSGLPPATAHVSIFTGGTATTVPRLLRTEGETVTITPAEIARVVELLASQSAQDVARHYGVQLQRAEVLPAGVKAIQTIEEFYRTREIVITSGGIREGAILEAERGAFAP